MKKQSWSAQRVAVVVFSAILTALWIYRLTSPRAFADGEGSGDSKTNIELNVSLTPNVAGDTNTPPITPAICTNAQACYLSAIFQAHVKDQNGKTDGYTATVSVVSGAVAVNPTTVSDGQTVTVSAAAGAAVGPYKLKIAPNGQKGVAQIAVGNVFQFDFQNIGITPGPITPAGAGKTYEFAWSKGAGAPNFTAAQGTQMAPYVGPMSYLPFTQTTTWEYKLITKPAGAYAGNAVCPTTITASTTAGALTCYGFAAIYGYGGYSSTGDFSDQISLAGLAAGNGVTAPRAYTCSAPTIAVVPIDVTNCAGVTTWVNPAAKYTVGAVVSSVDTMSMDASRGGMLPFLAAEIGICKDSGFTFTPGAFAIAP